MRDLPRVFHPAATGAGCDRLLGSIGYITPAEAEQNFYAQRDVLDMVA
jgi:hypothetical protein